MNNDMNWNLRYERNVRYRSLKDRADRKARLRKLDEEYALKFPNIHHRIIREK